MKFINLIKLRESLGMTQKQFAESLNLNKTTYNNYETGVREPRINFFELVAKTYNISVDYLLGLSTTPELQKNLINNFIESEKNHIRKYRSLNENGKNKATEYIDDLLENPKYVHFEPDYNAIKQQGKNMCEMARNLTPVKLDIDK